MSHLSKLKVSTDPADANAPEYEIIREYTAAVDPPNQAAAAIFGVDVAIAGLLLAKDRVIAVTPPAALEANLKPVAASVNADGNIRLVLQALAAVDGASLTWTFTVARKA